MKLCLHKANGNVHDMLLNEEDSLHRRKQQYYSGLHSETVSNVLTSVETKGVLGRKTVVLQNRTEVIFCNRTPLISNWTKTFAWTICVDYTATLWQLKSKKSF